MKASATYTPTKWDEKPYEQSSPPMRMTKASVEFTFKGQFEGLGQTEYVMFYKAYDEKDPHKSSAVYIGLTRLKGTLNGKSGSFVMEDRGIFEGGIANSVLTIVPNSGTEQLKGIAGSGKGSATQKGTKLELNYELK
jgi:hypothetical protein